MLKKKLSLALAALLLVGTLYGCGVSSTESLTHAELPDRELSGDNGEGCTAAEEPAMAEGMWDMEAGYYAQPEPGYSREGYQSIAENREMLTREEDTLTFSLKVDTASYTNVQRYVSNGQQPPADAVRTEELVNYFSYDEPVRFTGQEPFGVYTEVGQSVLNDGKYLAFIRVKTPEIDRAELPPTNLVFLIDTSGSMYSADKLPLLQQSFGLLVETLNEDDIVSIVTYAGSSEVVLDGVSGADKHVILAAIDSLSAGGSTAGAAGINTAYELAAQHFIEGGNNRVILATDGDFNVGISSVPQLEDFISAKRETGVYLSVLGFGTGNIQDDIMEALAANGNGNYSYINTLDTAKKVLVEELAANLYTVADDVKAQVQFTDAVQSYRLIGYENRTLQNEDFDNDAVDAGEIGAGTDVVMLFEFTLADGVTPTSGVPLFTVNLRYKNPGEGRSQLFSRSVSSSSIEGKGSTDFFFASAVAAFGHMLRNSEYCGDITLDEILSLATANIGEDAAGYRIGFVWMLHQYKQNNTATGTAIECW